MSTPTADEAGTAPDSVPTADVADQSDAAEKRGTEDPDEETATKEAGVADAPGKLVPGRWSRIATRGALAGLILALAVGVAFLAWQVSSARASEAARSASAAAAKDAAVALLSYEPDSAAEKLVAARDRLTGSFKDSYTKLTNDVVIPEAEKKAITAVASVPAVASVTASATSAVVLVLVDQTVVIGAEPPTSTASSVRVTLTKDGDRWLVSGFDPV